MGPDGRMPRVVVVGGGFGGLAAAQALRRAPVAVTLIDRANHFIFQPLLYQVATAGLSPAEISMPIRRVLRRQRNVEVLMAEVQSVDLDARTVSCSECSLPFDYLVLATGARHSYFGHDQWEADAPGLKSIDDAVRIRRRILLAFEHAEMECEPVARRARLTFVVVGAGPTGVELAGSIAELARRALASDFRRIDPSSARVLLLEAGPRVLPAFPPDSSARAERDLRRLGVEVHTGTRVVGIGAEAVSAEPGGQIPCRTTLWAAGIHAGGAGLWLGAPTDRAGRVKVDSNLTVSGSPHMFVIGDACGLADAQGQPLPGVAQVAMQQGAYAAEAIRRDVLGLSPQPPFRYRDKGTMATIGRSSAIFVRGRWHMGGWLAWVGWLFLHIWFLVGFRNRLLVLLEWAWAYWTWERGARLITPIEGPDPP